jgi:hypothetical protein
MKNLELRMQKMVDGEKKRREVAIKYVEKFEEFMDANRETIWGDDKHIVIDEDSGFFYNAWRSDINDCFKGFHFEGECLSEQKGRGFWVGIKQLLNYSKELEKIIDTKETFRNDLIKLLPLEVN